MRIGHIATRRYMNNYFFAWDKLAMPFMPLIHFSSFYETIFCLQ